VKACTLLLAVTISGCATSPQPLGVSNRPPREKLDQDDIVDAMKQVMPGVTSCFDRYKEAGMFVAAYTVIGTGHITLVHVRGPHVPTNNCVGGAVATARFPRFSGPPQSIVYPFFFR